MPGGMPAGMPGGMPGGAGGGGAGGGGGLTYEETVPPDHLQMTYDEFLAKMHLPKVPLPKAYVLDDKGQPQKLTKNEWIQNYDIYKEGAVAEKEAERGMGGPLADKARAEVDHIERERKAVLELYTYAVQHCFAAEISAPVLRAVSSTNPDRVSVGLGAIIRPTSKAFPDMVVRRLQPLSVPGWPWRSTPGPDSRIGAASGRARFDVITRGGGYYRPVKLYLDAGAIGRWMTLWSGTQVTINLLDTTGKVIQSQTRSAGFSGGSICQEMIFPPDAVPDRLIHHLPSVSPWGTKLKLFNGSMKDLYGTKGWLLGGAGFSGLLDFDLPTSALASLNGAEVELIPAAESSVPGLVIGHVGTKNATREKKH